MHKLVIVCYDIHVKSWKAQQSRSLQPRFEKGSVLDKYFKFLDDDLDLWIVTTTLTDSIGQMDAENESKACKIAFRKWGSEKSNCSIF